MTKTSKRPEPSVRRRLQPEERKEMLLDCAAAYLREHGIATLTMDGLAQYAGVSKPLIYNYFTNRMTLLKALLVREVNIRKKLDREVSARANTLDEFIEQSSWTMLQHIKDRGNIIQPLMQEAEIVQALSEMRSEARETYVESIAKRVRKQFGLPPTVAAIAVEIIMGMGTTAGALYEREQGDVKKVHRILVTLTHGALDALVATYGKNTSSTDS